MNAQIVVTRNLSSASASIGPDRNIEPYRNPLAFPSVERWLRKKAMGTKYEYLTRHSRIGEKIREVTGAKTPDEFVSWAKARDGTDVEDAIERIVENQRRATENGATVCLRSLLRKNGYNNLPKMDQLPGELQYHPGYKRGELHQLLAYLDRPIQKLYVLFAKDSGLCAQDLLSLCYCHVKKDLEKGEDYVHLELEPAYYNRKKTAGITFIGPDTVRLLKQLINNRTVKTETDAKIFPFKYSSMFEALQLAKMKGNLDRKIQPSHGLRKFFEQSLDRLGMDVHKKLQLEGHSQGVRIHYTDRNVDELRELYKQAYRYLDLSEQGAVDQTVGNLGQQVADLRDENKQLKDELSKQREVETLVREYLPLLRELSKDPEIKKRLASLKT